MTVLTPRMAVELASIVYDIQNPTETGEYRISLAGKEVGKHFSFDLNNGPIKGNSGGYLLNKTTGFAIIGKSQLGPYSGDHVIAIRGTDSAYDWVTDGNVGYSVSDNGQIVHQGFEKAFRSMKRSIQKYLDKNTNSIKSIHCVGHSLGGALAGLTADWIKKQYGVPVSLYTFGSPRVGLSGFSQATSSRVDNIFRCTHGADPVTKVPLWPFIHAPYGGFEYRLDNGQGISPSAHKMAGKSPGYLNTASGSDWGILSVASDAFLRTPVRLEYEKRHQASFNGYWADKLTSALITLLKDAGYYEAVLAQSTIANSLTFYDIVAQTLEKIAKISTKFAEQTKGLLGYMLTFSRAAISTISDLSYKTIKLVFNKTISALYTEVKNALN